MLQSCLLSFFFASIHCEFNHVFSCKVLGSFFLFIAIYDATVCKHISIHVLLPPSNLFPGTLFFFSFLFYYAIKSLRACINMFFFHLVQEILFPGDPFFVCLFFLFFYYAIKSLRACINMVFFHLVQGIYEAITAKNIIMINRKG